MESGLLHGRNLGQNKLGRMNVGRKASTCMTFSTYLSSGTFGSSALSRSGDRARSPRVRPLGVIKGHAYDFLQVPVEWVDFAEIEAHTIECTLAGRGTKSEEDGTEGPSDRRGDGETHLLDLFAEIGASMARRTSTTSLI